MIALVDCNNFYASCERIFRPHLTKKPVAVLSNNDGCVIARSNESKSLGLKMGEPIFKKRHLVTDTISTSSLQILLCMEIYPKEFSTLLLEMSLRMRYIQ